MRIINVDLVVSAIKEMCIEANHFLSQDIKDAIEEAAKKEESVVGRQILEQLQENLNIAKQEMIPICQDTGMAVIFMEIGQDVHFEGGFLEDAIHEGVRQGYGEGYLRKSVVGNPILRKNTGDNTPAIIHYSIVPGDQVHITVAPKGFGSENMSRIRMFNPTAERQEIIRFVAETVKTAASNPCPPVIVGVGIGGTFEKAALLSKKALTRDLDIKNKDPFYAQLEEDMLTAVNQTGIGAQGFGGCVTALGVNIETFATHIAGLPVAVNMGCHVTRHSTIII